MKSICLPLYTGQKIEGSQVSPGRKTSFYQKKNMQNDGKAAWLRIQKLKK